MEHLGTCESDPEFTAEDRAFLDNEPEVFTAELASDDEISKQPVLVTKRVRKQTVFFTPDGPNLCSDSDVEFSASEAESEDSEWEDI